MKHLFTVCIVIFSLNLCAQESDPWVRYMTPTDIHDLFASYSGDFNMEITMWMIEGQEPTRVTVQSTNEMILGGRFLQLTQSGDMVGMPYDAINILGFNTISTEVSLTSVTNMGTGTLSLTGSWDGDKKIADLTGTIADPETGGTIHVRQQITFIDSDTILIENYDRRGDEAEYKSIEYRFTRQ